MANVLKMEKQILIRQLLDLGWSYRRIERETGIRRETISKYDDRDSKAAKVPTDESDTAVQKRPKCPPGCRPTRTSSAAPYDEFIRERLAKGLSAQRIYQDLVVEYGYEASYDSVKRYVRRVRKTAPRVFARLHAAPGEEAQVDFGRGAPTAKNGRYVRPWLFKMVLSYSRHSYEEVVWRQDVETFIRCHERAFDAFGGVSRMVRIDNLKSGVLEANLYEPVLNPAYAAFADHAGFAPLPCLPGKPEHKGKVESGVGYTKKNALAGLRFESLEEQNAHLRRWNRTWARTRIHGTTKRQVWRLFVEDERDALLPLPGSSFTFFEVGLRKVHVDGHVEIQRSYYSVPHRLVGQSVVVHYCQKWVKVFDQGERVAFHRRVDPGRFKTMGSHLPRRKVRSTVEFAALMLDRCTRIGPGCRLWAEAVLGARGQLGLRAIQGVVRLERKYTAEQIDWACHSAVEAGSLRYHTVELLCREEETTTVPELLTTHEVIRPLAEYQRHLNTLNE
jgi:transposase